MSSPEKPEKTLKEKAVEWLESEGFPLEFLTASVFQKNNFDVRQGFYVRDIKTEAPREIDVKADVTKQIDSSYLRISHVVECKWSKDKPWIIFTSTNSNLHPTACVAQTIGSDAGEAIIWTLAGDEKLQSLDAFSAPPRPGFGGRQAFNKGSDVFYTTLQSVTALTFSLMNWYNGPSRTIKKALEVVVIVFPVVVVDGQLFEAYFNSATGKMVIEEANRLRVHWRGAGRLNVSVDVVSASHLNDFVEKRKEEMPILLERTAACLSQIHRCVRERSLKPLEITEGPRGFHGIPSLLEAIRDLGRDSDHQLMLK